MKIRCLIIDDEPLAVRLVDSYCQQMPELEVVGTCNSAIEAYRVLQQYRVDLLFLDIKMPQLLGTDFIRGLTNPPKVILITAYGSVEVAVTALKRGANDYFSKPWDNEKLLIEIDRMISKRRLERENIELKRALKQRYSFPNIVGKSERMLKILDLVAQVAPSRATILITGETGTGKELIAKGIHANSARAGRPSPGRPASCTTMSCHPLSRLRFIRSSSEVRTIL